MGIDEILELRLPNEAGILEQSSSGLSCGSFDLVTFFKVCVSSEE